MLSLMLNAFHAKSREYYRFIYIYVIRLCIYSQTSAHKKTPAIGQTTTSCMSKDYHKYITVIIMSLRSLSYITVIISHAVSHATDELRVRLIIKDTGHKILILR